MRLTVLAFILSAAPAVAQSSYDVALDSAYTLVRVAALEDAVAQYEVAFSLAKPENPYEPFGAAENAMRARRPRQAIAFLYLAAKTGFSGLLYAHRVPDLDPLRADAAMWERWVDAVHRAQAAIHPGYDEAFARDVIRLALEVERAADRRFSLEGDTTLSGAERESRLAALEAAESAVESQVVDLLEERGWPRESEVGHEGAQAIYELMGRLSPEVRERFLPAYRAAVEDDEASTDRYVEVVDQYRVDTQRTQLYGTAFWWDDDAGESVSYPIEDGADERRAALGMVSLEEWFGRMNRLWPPRTGWPPE